MMIESGPVILNYQDARVSFPAVVVTLQPGERVSDGIKAGNARFIETFQRAATIVTMQALPKGAEEFMEVDGVTLVTDADVLPGKLFLRASGTTETHYGNHRA